jgi:hypothetical protein
MMELNQLAHYLNDNEDGGANKLLERMGLNQAYEYVANGATLMIVALLLGIAAVVLASFALCEYFVETTDYSRAVALLIVMAIDLGAAYLMYELGNWLINRSIEAVELKEINEMQRELEMQQMEMQQIGRLQSEEEAEEENEELQTRGRGDSVESLSATEMQQLHETTEDLVSGKTSLVPRKARKARRGSMPEVALPGDIGAPPTPKMDGGRRGSLFGKATPDGDDTLKQNRKSQKRSSTAMDLSAELLRTTSTAGGVVRKPSHNSSQAFFQGLHLLGTVTGQDTTNLDRAGALITDEKTNAVLNSALETLLGVKLPPQQEGGEAAQRRGSMFGAIQETICEGLLNMCEGHLRNMTVTGMSIRGKRRAMVRRKKGGSKRSDLLSAGEQTAGEQTEDEDYGASSSGRRRRRRRRGAGIQVSWRSRWCVLTQTHLQIFKDARKPRTIMERPLLAIPTNKIHKVTKIKLAKREMPSVAMMAVLSPSNSVDSAAGSGKKGRSSFGGKMGAKASFKSPRNKRSGRKRRGDRDAERPNSYCFQVLTEPFSGYYNFCAETVEMREQWERRLLHASMDQKMQEKEQRRAYTKEQNAGHDAHGRPRTRSRAASVESINGDGDDEDGVSTRQRKRLSPRSSFDGDSTPIGLDELTQQLENGAEGSIDAAIDAASDTTELNQDAEALARAMVTVRAAEKKLEFRGDRRLTMQVETVVVHAGYLSKRSKKMKRWQRRFFELRGHFLSYYKERHLDAKGVLNLDNLERVHLIR